MSHITIGVIVFACVFGAGLVGLFVHSRLPNELLESDSREAVRLAMGLVGDNRGVSAGTADRFEQGVLRYSELRSHPARRGCGVAG